MKVTGEANRGDEEDRSDRLDRSGRGVTSDMGYREGRVTVRKVGRG